MGIGPRGSLARLEWSDDVWNARAEVGRLVAEKALVQGNVDDIDSTATAAAAVMAVMGWVGPLMFVGGKQRLDWMLVS